MLEVFSIGHSTLSYDEFLDGLRRHGINAIADVRSVPFSRNFPQFNRDILKAALKGDGVAYSFLGRQLGGRPSDPSLLTNGVADYARMALTDEFQSGLERVREGASKFRIALMCSEREPLDCHRCLLVGRALSETGCSLYHVIPNRSSLSQLDIEAKLLNMSDKANEDMFSPLGERIDHAYRNRARKVAYSDPETA